MLLLLVLFWGEMRQQLSKHYTISLQPPILYFISFSEVIKHFCFVSLVCFNFYFCFSSFFLSSNIKWKHEWDYGLPMNMLTIVQRSGLKLTSDNEFVDFINSIKTVTIFQKLKHTRKKFVVFKEIEIHLHKYTLNEFILSLLFTCYILINCGCINV